MRVFEYRRTLQRVFMNMTDECGRWDAMRFGGPWWGLWRGLSAPGLTASEKQRNESVGHSNRVTLLRLQEYAEGTPAEALQQSPEHLEVASLYSASCWMQPKQLKKNFSHWRFKILNTNRRFGDSNATSGGFKANRSVPIRCVHTLEVYF